MTLDQLHERGFDASSRSGKHARVKCSQCAAAVINGVPCHETGCPNIPHECHECGTLHPTRRDAAECCSLDDYAGLTEDDL